MRLVASPVATPLLISGVAALLLAGSVSAIALVTATATPAAAATQPDAEYAEPPAPTADDALILELYPNPVADADAGEYLLLDLPIRGNWSLSDGHHAAEIPPTTAGRVAVSTDPEAARRRVDAPVYALDDRFPLADDGDRIELRYEDVVVDVVRYDRATEADIWHRRGASDNTASDDATEGYWRPYGYEPRTPTDTGAATVEGFVLPDDADAPLDPVKRADDRLYLAAYTLESWRVVEAIANATARGVEVRILVEGGPVGGISRNGAAVLDRIAATEAEVRVLDGPRTRFTFHHAKYAVADDEAIVLTENWKPAGTGGAGSRGWGVRIDGEETADELATLFANDAGWRDTTPWSEFREGRLFHERDPADGDFPDRFDPVAVEADSVTVLTAPGNAEDELVARIDDADVRAYAVVPRTGGAEQRLVRALVRAAERDVDVRLLLSGAWYDREENAELAARLSEYAERADLPLSVAVAEPRGRYEKVHAKGVVVDDAVVVGSLNWNDHAASRNREVLLAIESRELADYFARVYAADWRGGSAMLPVGLLGGSGAVLAGALLLARREVRFQ